jgi:4-hydroxy-4-methyl-2-oxoglutarate aldolase
LAFQGISLKLRVHTGVQGDGLSDYSGVTVHDTDSKTEEKPMALSNERFEEVRRSLYTPVISDVLDALGLRHQVMKPFVRPLDADQVLFGPVRTGMYMPTQSVAEGENPYEIEIDLIDDLKPGEVAVLGCNGPTECIGPWGELLTTASAARGAAGCVTDGLVRDTRQIRAMGFPVFHGGIGPFDSRGRGKMMTRDLPIACAGVVVNPGDYVFGDVDGVVVIPLAALQATIANALEKVKGEDRVRDEIRAGNSLKSVFEKYRIL